MTESLPQRDKRMTESLPQRDASSQYGVWSRMVPLVPQKFKAGVGKGLLGGSASRSYHGFSGLVEC